MRVLTLAALAAVGATLLVFILRRAPAEAVPTLEPSRVAEVRAAEPPAPPRIEGWFELRADESRFRSQMPGRAVRACGDAEYEGSGWCAYHVKAETAVFLINCTRFPDPPAGASGWSTQAVLARTRDALEKGDVEILGENALRHRGWPALDFSGTEQGVSYRARAVVIGRRKCILHAVGASERDAGLFIDSFVPDEPEDDFRFPDLEASPAI